MKKKIIYFCAGVLLTSLVLVAIQVVATAPNPGHDESAISILGKTAYKIVQVGALVSATNVNPPGSCNTACAELSGTCTAGWCSYWGGDWGCGCTAATYGGTDLTNCMCNIPAHEELWWH